MDKEELIDLMEEELAKANEYSKKLSQMVREAKATNKGLTKDLMEEMVAHQKAWSAAIEKHNELARQLFAIKNDIAK